MLADTLSNTREQVVDELEHLADGSIGSGLPSAGRRDRLEGLLEDIVKALHSGGVDEEALLSESTVDPAIERDERVCMLIDQIDVVGRERERFVETLQRLGRALERVLGLPEIVPGIGKLRPGLDRGGEQALRLADLAELHFDRAEKIERIELIGRGLEHARIDSLGLA